MLRFRANKRMRAAIQSVRDFGSSQTQGPSQDRDQREFNKLV